MIFGSYPCCQASLLISMPSITPTFMKDKCPECGAVVWHKLSRIGSASYTEEEFEKRFDVDEETATIITKAKGLDNEH